MIEIDPFPLTWIPGKPRTEIFHPYALPDSLSWWSVLGVSPNASATEIKLAYRSLSLRHHPDAGGDRLSWERLSKAYEEALKASQRPVT